jgi:hypothetical protein
MDFLPECLRVRVAASPKLGSGRGEGVGRDALSTSPITLRRVETPAIHSGLHRRPARLSRPAAALFLATSERSWKRSVFPVFPTALDELSVVPAGLARFAILTQGSRPGLNHAAPLALEFGGAMGPETLVDSEAETYILRPRSRFPLGVVYLRLSG